MNYYFVINSQNSLTTHTKELLLLKKSNVYLILQNKFSKNRTKNMA